MLSYLKYNNQTQAECAAATESETAQPQYIRNTLEKRAFVLQYPANDPCEDRFNCYQFKNSQAYYAAVFDGHGGWQVSDYAMRKLHVYLDEELSKASKNEKDIK